MRPRGGLDRAVSSEYRTMYDPTREEYLRDVEKAKERECRSGR